VLSVIVMVIALMLLLTRSTDALPAQAEHAEFAKSALAAADHYAAAGMDPAAPAAARCRFTSSASFEQVFTDCVPVLIGGAYLIIGNQFGAVGHDLRSIAS
jgi:hypothetical protein